MGSRYRYAMVCHSNMNRSMETHTVLANEGYEVCSFGTGEKVRLPGPSIHKPNIYNFGTPYTVIYEELKHKDPDLYTRNGLLQMLDRNRSVKEAPQRWQLSNVTDIDVAVCFEKRVFDEVVKDLQDRVDRDSGVGASVFVINQETKDRHDEARIAAGLTLDLCQSLEACDDLDCEIDRVISDFEARYGKELQYTLMFC